MANVGSYGSIIFEVSDSSIRTFKRLRRQHKAVYAEHEVVDGKNLLQFTSLGLQELSFSMDFSIRVSDPRGELEALQAKLEDHKADMMIIEGKPLGLFVLEEISETWTYFGREGQLLSAGARVRLKEYVE